MPEPLTTFPASPASALFTMSIHEEVGVVLASLKSPQGPGNGNPDKLRQAVLKDEGGASPSTSKTIVHWSFVDQSKEYSLLLRLQMEERHDDGETRIAVESVDEEDLDSTCRPSLLALTTLMLVRERLAQARPQQ
ncbi:hypothetical protein TrST_g6938 [Triparma strigata]|uniref:Uncharacterized protein n=1 Tax=Triparma strigata TaxID=1606541 RepID=A0A9W7ERQ3_9STRA|nr:hypothetical protein TrST_g6938 [Triparma strigata]